MPKQMAGAWNWAAVTLGVKSIAPTMMMNADAANSA
jgi:hypothetical protein